MAKSYNQLRKKMPKAAQKRAEAKVVRLMQQMPLSTLRKALSISQMELAKRLKSEQPHISKLERQKDMRLSTLQSYVEGLGGKLEVKAKFPKNREVKIELGDT